jgi:c-di-GMP-binding flagellar brake protein YcgR
VDGGFGVKFEKNPEIDGRTDPRLQRRRQVRAQALADLDDHQGFSALWKADDFGDALYNFSAGAAAALTARTQLKIELLDTYASRPPNETVKSNDVALITALVYKF